MAVAVTDLKPQGMSIEEAHDKLGHSDKNPLSKQQLSWELISLMMAWMFVKLVKLVLWQKSSNIIFQRKQPPTSNKWWLQSLPPHHYLGERTKTGEDTDAPSIAAETLMGEREDSDSDSDQDEESEREASAEMKWAASKRSGWVVNKPARLIEDAGTTKFQGYEIKLMDAEELYYEAMKELNEGEFIPNEVNSLEWVYWR
jgi:hypothetical protein